jgi:hypothetical protein
LGCISTIWKASDFYGYTGRCEIRGCLKIGSSSSIGCTIHEPHDMGWELCYAPRICQVTRTTEPRGKRTSWDGCMGGHIVGFFFYSIFFSGHVWRHSPRPVTRRPGGQIRQTVGGGIVSFSGKGGAPTERCKVLRRATVCVPTVHHPPHLTLLSGPSLTILGSTCPWPYSCDRVQVLYSLGRGLQDQHILA